MISIWMMTIWMMTITLHLGELFLELLVLLYELVLVQLFEFLRPGYAVRVVVWVN